MQPQVDDLHSEALRLCRGLGAARRVVWLQPVEDIGQRETLRSRIASGERPEHFQK